MADKEKVIGFKVDTKTAQKNVEELNKSFEAQTDLIDDLENELMQYEKMLRDTSKADLAGRKKVNEAIQKTKDRLKEEKFALKSLNKDRKKANEELKESIANQRDYSGVLGFLDKQTGGAISGFKNLISTISNATKGFNLMKIAIIGTGVGALVIAVTALISAFKGSEAGQNKFAKLMSVIGVVTGNVIDVFADLGDMIISAFENPKKAISKLASLISTNITNRVKGLIELFPQLGKAIQQTFSGDFAGAMETATNAVGKVTLGLEKTTDTYKNLTGAVGDFIDKNNEEMKMGAKVADMRAKADKIERGLLKDRALAEREVAELRLKARDLNNTTAKEREEALKKVLEIEDSLIGREQEVANLRRDAQIAENSFARSTKENLDEEERLKAEAIAVETRRLNKQRQVQRELTQAENQILADKKARLKEEQEAQAEADKAKLEAQKVLSDKTKELQDRLKEQEAETEEEKLALAKDKEIKALENMIGTEAEKREAKMAINQYYDELEDELAEKRKQEKKEKDDEERAELDEKLAEIRQGELDTEQELINQKMAIQDQYIGHVQGLASVLGRLAGDNEALATASLVLEKGVAIANVVIATTRANAELMTTAKTKATQAVAEGYFNQSKGVAMLAGGNPLGAGLVTAGAKQIATSPAIIGMATKGVVANKVSAGVSIASILASSIKGGSKSPKGGNGGGASGGGGLSSATPAQSASLQRADQRAQDSNFDAVGNEVSRGQGQAIQNANAQSDSPVRAYVTSTDVASGAQFERNRVDVAGF